MLKIKQFNFDRAKLGFSVRLNRLNGSDVEAVLTGIHNLYLSENQKKKNNVHPCIPHFFLHKEEFRCGHLKTEISYKPIHR